MSTEHMLNQRFETSELMLALVFTFETEEIGAEFIQVRPYTVWSFKHKGYNHKVHYHESLLKVGEQ